VSAVPITAADIALYSRYDGDLDGLSRSANRDAEVSDTNWHLVDDLRQRGFIVASGRGSEAFGEEFELDLLTHIPDERARHDLRQLIDADLKRADRDT
jgi:hypothetical protein